MGKNERLRAAMVSSRVTVEDLAERVEVDPKTVQRWLGGRRPHTRHQWSVASVLGEDVDNLWPPGGLQVANGDTSTHELVALYANRAAAPPELWWRLMVAARSHVDILGYAVLFLHEQHAGLTELLASKATSGGSVRIALVDPNSGVAAARDEEEGLSEGLVARIRTSTLYFRELVGVAGVEFRRHATPLYNSVFRFDDHMLVTPHLYGVPGARAPLLHLQRRGPDGVFGRFQGHFDAVWATATPMPAED